MKKSDYLFILFIAVLLFLYGFDKIIMMRPYSIHQWRQTDCLSITLNYTKSGNPFLEPSIHNCLTGEGKVVSEFPLLYYIIGEIWKITGQKEILFRILSLGIVILGLFSLYKLSSNILKNSYAGILVALVLFTSSLLVYYSGNFLMNAPAFAFALIGGYFTYKFITKEHLIFLVAAGCFFALAGLLKISSLMLFLALSAVYLFSVLGWFGLKQISGKNRIVVFAAIFLVLLINAIWYFYAVHYNTINGTRGAIFLQGIYPIWNLDKNALHYVTQRFFNNLLPVYYHPSFIYLILVLFIFNIISFKKCNRALVILDILVFLEVLAYILLFYKAFDVHDYYLTDLLLFVPVTILTSAECFFRYRKNYFSKSYVLVPIMLYLIFLSYNTSLRIRLRYNLYKGFPAMVLLPKEERHVYSWYHWHYKTYFSAYETFEPILRNAGITREDKVISLPDQSINITLYLMDQKGFTDFGRRKNPPVTTGEWIEKCIGKGAKYLVINDPKLLEDSTALPYYDKKLLEYNNLILFDLKDFSPVKE